MIRLAQYVYFYLSFRPWEIAQSELFRSICSFPSVAWVRSACFGVRSYMSCALRVRGGGCGGSKPEAATELNPASPLAKEANVPTPQPQVQPAVKTADLVVDVAAPAPAPVHGLGALKAPPSKDLRASNTSLSSDTSIAAGMAAVRFANKLKARAAATRKRKKAVFDGGMMWHEDPTNPEVLEMVARARRESLQDTLVDSKMPEERQALVKAALPSIALLPERLQMVLLRSLQEKHAICRAGKTLITRSHLLDTCYIILSGQFVMHSTAIDPSQSFPVKTFTEGMVIGEGALKATIRSPFSIRCLEQAEVFSIAGRVYRAIVDHTVEAQQHMGDDDLATFLRSLPCCKGVPADAISEIASKAQLAVCEDREALAEVLEKGNSSGSIFILKAGACAITLQRAEEDESKRLSSHSDGNTKVVMMPGDVLGQQALDAFAVVSRFAARKRSMSIFAMASVENADTLTSQLGSSSKADSAKVAVVEITREQLRDGNFPFSIVREAERCFARKILQSMEIFHDFSFDDIDAALNGARWEEFTSGKAVIEQGTTGDTPLYIIMRGTARIWRPQDGSDEGETITNLAVGEHFGAAGMLTPGEPRGASTTALTALECLAFSTGAFGAQSEHVKHVLTRALAHEQWVLTNRNTVNWDDLRMGAVLGQGAFGRVKLVEHTKTNETYALKCLRKTQVAKTGQQGHVISECKLLEMCSHPFINRLVAAYQDTENLYMVLEIVLGGELYALHAKSGSFSTSQGQFYTACTVLAIGYLNSLDIVYRDIKLENLMVDASGYLKLVDFGFAKAIDTESGHRAFTFCGTPDYMAPEVVQFTGHLLPCDYWSIGVLVFEMLVGTTPFDAERPRDIFKSILDFAFTGSPAPSFPFFFNMKAKDFVYKCLVGDPGARMNPSQMMAHPFLQDFDRLQLERREVEPPHKPVIKQKDDTSNFNTDEVEESGSEDEDDDDEPISKDMLRRLKEPETFPVFDHLGSFAKVRMADREGADDDDEEDDD